MSVPACCTFCCINEEAGVSGGLLLSIMLLSLVFVGKGGADAVTDDFSASASGLHNGSHLNLAPFFNNIDSVPAHIVVKFQSWALFTNFRCKKGNEGGRYLRQDCRG